MGLSSAGVDATGRPAGAAGSSVGAAVVVGAVAVVVSMGGSAVDGDLQAAADVHAT